MTCKGIIGWIFGHRFESHVIEYEMNPKSYFDAPYHLMIKMMEMSANKKYVILCKRCGLKSEEK